ncbi:MAG: AraC family transcriptional regulator [Myxococcales bacterium]|nr:AraC family transcriptional regulator [Myxococcales bacterium]
MNVTAEKRPQEVWLGQGHLLFEGYLGFLDWHQHSFLCLLVGLEGTFEVTWKGGRASCEILLVPPSWSHQLEFGQGRVFSFYIAPHERTFASLLRASGGAPLFAELSSRWGAALGAWAVQRDPSLLRKAILEAWLGDAAFDALDVRVMRILQSFSHGDGLDEDNDALGQRVGLSASRLRHLLKEETGSSVRHLRRGYRFWLAARAMIEGTSFTEAAHAAGFSDAAHFSRAFREAYGMSPTHIVPMPTQWFDCPLL